MITNQVYIFLWTLLIGCIMGIVFDFFRVLRRKKNTKDIWVYVQDIIFWIIIAIIIIVTTFLINDGELRGYMIIGYLLGAILYILLFSNLIRKILSFVFDLFAKIQNTFKKIISKIIRGIKKDKILEENVKV